MTVTHDVIRGEHCEMECILSGFSHLARDIESNFHRVNGSLLWLLLDREELGSTGVGDGIAVPYFYTDDLGAILRPKVIIGLLRKPIDWEAYDNKPVDTVCVLLCPSGDTHLALLGELARSLTSPRVRKLLSERASLNQVVEAVRATLP